MQKSVTVFTLCASVLLFGCDDVTEPGDPLADAPPRLANSGVLGSLTGGGHNQIAGLDVKFSFSAVQKDADGAGTGQFRFSVIFEDELVEFHGRTTCVTFDAENDRAWVGGVITQNNSTHPFWMQDINDVGRDIWFRAVDYGEGGNAAQVDRNTFVGFEGNAGIDTSEEYCDAQIWPEDDARTLPVTQGNVQVRAPS